MLRLFKKYVTVPALICALCAPLFMLLEVFMDLQQPTLMSDIIDTGVANGDVQFVLHTGIRMLIYAFLGMIGGAGCSVLAVYASVQMGGILRKQLFSKIQTLSIAEIDQLEPSSLITRMTNDVMQLQNMMVMFLRGMFRTPLLCIGGIIMSFLLSPRLALILCAAIPILIVFYVMIVTRAVPVFSRVQLQLDRINTVMRENLMGVRVIKAFRLETRQLSLFSGINKMLTDKSIEAQSVTVLMMPIVTLIMNLSIVAVLWFGGNMQVSGSMENGKIIAFVNYLVQITNALMFLVSIVVSISRAKASAPRIQEVLDTLPSVTEPDLPLLPQNNDIEFKHVSFRYSTGDYVLKDLSFTLQTGRKFGIIGATGSGKSTLVSLIDRMYDVSEGSITLGGIDLRSIQLSVLRKKVGIVLQESLLLSGTVLENLRYGDESAGDFVLQNAVMTAQADGFLNNLPGRLDSRVEQRGKNFSGGQKQRLSIARTLVQNPEILILDDSTSAVDLITDAQLKASINRFLSGRTMIMIAQRISSIMDSDAILVIDEGRLYAMGAHSDLLRTCDIYRQIAVSQLGEEALTL